MSETPKSCDVSEIWANGENQEPNTDASPERLARLEKEPKSVDRMPDREGNSMTGKKL